jgi:hypothetical protein
MLATDVCVCTLLFKISQHRVQAAWREAGCFSILLVKGRGNSAALPDSNGAWDEEDSTYSDSYNANNNNNGRSAGAASLELPGGQGGWTDVTSAQGTAV